MGASLQKKAGVARMVGMLDTISAPIKLAVVVVGYE